MSEYSVSKYLVASFDVSSIQSPKKDSLVVTVSRDTGCDALQVVKDLVRKLNEDIRPYERHTHWRYVSKEILEKAAKKLSLKPNKVDQLLGGNDKSLVEEMVLSFSSSLHPSDLKVRRIVKEIIQSIDSKGNVAILGRAGVAILPHDKKHIHIKLTAPVKWRIDKIHKEYGVSLKEAETHILSSDKARTSMIRHFLGKKPDPAIFDAVLNVKSLSKTEICQTIYGLIKMKEV